MISSESPQSFSKSAETGTIEVEKQGRLETPLEQSEVAGRERAIDPPPPSVKIFKLSSTPPPHKNKSEEDDGSERREVSLD